MKHRCICRGRDSWIPVRSPLILEKGFPTEITWHVSIWWATAGSVVFHPLPHAACLAVSKPSHYLWWNDVKFMFSWRFLIFIPMVDARCWSSDFQWFWFLILWALKGTTFVLGYWDSWRCAEWEQSRPYRVRNCARWFMGRSKLQNFSPYYQASSHFQVPKMVKIT